MGEERKFGEKIGWPHTHFPPKFWIDFEPKYSFPGCPHPRAREGLLNLRSFARCVAVDTAAVAVDASDAGSNQNRVLLARGILNGLRLSVGITAIRSNTKLH
ncbi:hypothetical protein K1719_028160 [Acacia pycnantha]|nr:hypothetical protein K1719_028160 [Acacia pycnantha]